MEVQMRIWVLVFSVIVMVAAQAPAASALTLWYHNGSTVYLAADGSSRVFYYANPRPGMLEYGARPGSVLFEGHSTEGHYDGIAYVFRGHCGQFPYYVSGPILDNYRRVILYGLAPRVDAYCHIHGYFEDRLEFTYLEKLEEGSPESY
jgi:hypothetical protein